MTTAEEKVLELTAALRLLRKNLAGNPEDLGPEQLRYQMAMAQVYLDALIRYAEI